MVKTAGSKFCLVFPVLLLLDCTWAAPCFWARGDAHSLHYDFNVTANRQPWCKVQGQVDEKNFLFYDCGSKKVICMNHLREDINATKVWKDQIDTLCHVGDLLKQQLPDIKLEKYPDSVPLTLQARMTCECKANGRTSASWEFSFNGQRYLLFDSKTRKYTVGHPGGEQIKEKWEHDKELMAHFTKISLGDCQEWLPALVHWEKQVDTTAPTTTVPNTAPPTKAAATAHSKASTVTPIAWNLPLFLTCWIIMYVL
ncbi:UL16-binding protein 3-like isoform X2 [Rhinolophus ferrumequinum]|uniref:MHC class I-like antigen recognition-like domain-containing protein n=1 Tax=Rhinolophus ferrumequinum TaxID=59479 RepID=A0A671FIC1_RHIFE|nr:UL16-binding protein 3-like isoform X2 [Rhinolophus ferrumequinum]